MVGNDDSGLVGNRLVIPVMPKGKIAGTIGLRRFNSIRDLPGFLL